MTKHIHIHISTRDAGFDEGQHPRDHGKFTSGGGSSATAKKSSTTPAGESHEVIPYVRESHSRSLALLEHLTKAPKGQRNNLAISATLKHVQELEKKYPGLGKSKGLPAMPADPDRKSLGRVLKSKA